MKLTAIQQADLIGASNGGVDRIDAVIQKLKEECPNAFHTNTTLATRVFVHRPAAETPCRGFVHGSTTS
jgi:chemotaxis response regulator CheB